MKKFLIPLFLCFSLFFSLSFAVTIDLSDYYLPDLDTGNNPNVYSNYIVYETSGVPVCLFTSTQLEGKSDNNDIYIMTETLLTEYSLSGNTWQLSNFDNGTTYGDSGMEQYSSYSDIITSNYAFVAYDDDSIIFSPTSEGGESMSTILTDLTTVMTSVLSNATLLVTWITNNPLVYLWVILAIILVIISFVKGFIRGV